MSRATTPSNHFDSVVLQKEKEWREAFHLRVKALEDTIVQKDKELKQEKLRFRKLKEDFEYNLKLIIERDAELEKYDAVIGKVKEEEHVKTAEASELCVKIDELKVKLDNNQKAKDELQQHYQKRLQEYQREFKAFRELKDSEVAKEREEMSSYRRDLDSQLRKAEDDFEFRRQELVSDFDEVMRKREQEYRSKLDDASSLLLSNDIKIRSLTKELELVRCHSGRCKAELDQTELTSRELEKIAKEKDWMIADLENTHKYKVMDLETQIENLKKTGQKTREDFQRKHAELDRLVREREEMLSNAKQGFVEEEQQLREKIRNTQSQLDTKQQEYQQKEWRYVDKLKENDITIQNLHRSVSELKEQLEKEQQEYSRLTVAKDVELETLHQQEAKLRTELAQRRDDLERRQKDLTLSLEREAAGERARVQLDLDWQRRCEEAERTGYDKQEELVENLSRSKEEALSQVKQQKRELQHKDSVIRVLTSQRDESIATLKLHGLSVPSKVPTKDTSVPFQDNSAELQVQNENLRQIIHQMREDMEDLTKQLSERTVGSNTAVPITEEYVASLEKEIREIKAKNRELAQSLSKTRSKPPEEFHVVDGTKDDSHIREIVKQLNSTIGSLRQEKLDLTSQMRKCEATVIHLQGLLHQSREEVRQKQLNIDQLQYHLRTEHRRAEEEINALKMRNSDLSLQVSQARREADEFYKTGLERNIDAVALGNQLSVLKLDLAGQEKAVNSYNPQTSVVRGLHDENERLKIQLERNITGNKRVESLPSCQMLQNKLRDAGQRINELTKEREQLIKMGNKLRAELLKYKGNRDSDVASQTSTAPPTFRSNLRCLEQLQYQLTSKELRYAQKTLAKNTETLVSAEENTPTVPVSLHQPAYQSKPAENSGVQVQAHDDIISPWQPSFSSDDRSSLQEVWKLLDEESPGQSSREMATPREKDEARGRHASSSTTDSFTVKGQPTHVLSKPETTKPVLSAKAAGKWRPAQAKAKIRNYNIRDEDVREGL